jgi:hypothetical protein
MPYCRRCGTLNADDSKYCANCGNPTTANSSAADEFGRRISEEAQDFATRMQQQGTRVGDRVGETVRREVDLRFGQTPPEASRNESLLGAISAGAVLIMIALTFLRFPTVFTVMGDYFRSMGELGIFFRPPQIMLEAAYFFFAAIGLWTLAMAVLRLLVQRSARRALNEAAGGLFSFYVAFVISLYAALRVGGIGAVALIIVGLGALVIVHGFIALALPWRRQTPG